MQGFWFFLLIGLHNHCCRALLLNSLRLHAGVSYEVAAVPVLSFPGLSWVVGLLKHYARFLFVSAHWAARPLL